MNIKTEKLKTAVKRLLAREAKEFKKPAKEDLKIKKGSEVIETIGYFLMFSVALGSAVLIVKTFIDILREKL